MTHTCCTATDFLKSGPLSFAHLFCRERGVWERERRAELARVERDSSRELLAPSAFPNTSRKAIVLLSSRPTIHNMQINLNKLSPSLESLELETTVTLTFSAACCSLRAMRCASWSSCEVSWYWSFSTAFSWLWRSSFSSPGVFPTGTGLAGGCGGWTEKIPGGALLLPPKKLRVVQTEKWDLLVKPFRLNTV